MTSYETATLAVSVGRLAIGVGQIALVWYGIGRMVQANEDRGKAQAAMMA